MADKRKYFDQAIGEGAGNGGDLQMLGNDLAIVYGQENQVYLALFGGNVEQSTPAINTVASQRFDWWGNSLLMPNDSSRQFNSSTERVLNTTALNSAGRIKIENAVKDDLKYLTQLGAKVTVAVSLPDKINTVKIEVTTVYSEGNKNLTIITFGKRTSVSGDFSLLDFSSEDFY